MLARKYPERSGATIYGDSGWLSRWFGSGPRVYYGVFGRGLFQSLYRVGEFPLAMQIPLLPSWVIVSLILLLAGLLTGSAISIIGAVGLLLTVLSADRISVNQHTGSPALGYSFAHPFDAAVSARSDSA